MRSCPEYWKIPKSNLFCSPGGLMSQLMLNISNEELFSVSVILVKRQSEAQNKNNKVTEIIPKRVEMQFFL